MSTNNKQIKSLPELTDKEKGHLESVFGRKLTREKIERRLKRTHNVEPDELKAIYPNDSDLIKAYFDVFRKTHKHNIVEEDAEEDDTTPDTYTSQKVKLAQEGEVMQLAESLKKAAHKKTAAQMKKEKAAFDEVSKMLPEEGQVSYEDYLKSLREGLS